MARRVPAWGNFVYKADTHLISFAVLNHYMVYESAICHAVQALENYLKALALSIAESTHDSGTDYDDSWLRTHDLVRFAKRCAKKIPYYGEENLLDDLLQFYEVAKSLRDPTSERADTSGFSTTDYNKFEEIILRLRTDIPIIKDDFPLGVLIRGHSHGRPSKHKSALLPDSHRISAALLRNVITRADQLVRW